ncbi:MAG TPA: type II secretion system GspH family protein [Candidatus Atopostipes pullistercoris]|uniref:Type II secretion system GspH family protein n=1 Tax=Candidatus Atopostipes pullistercoris TaxID=2838467 RepID=A0A9D2G1H8_9LACT|nr:type II secretion system GspH family protein [Candidatus Atopostipes pullistercoris]
MKYEKKSEQGFLLLESLVTLGMIASISLLIYPMIARWMLIRKEAKDEIELNRIFYEASMEWNTTQSLDENYKGYVIQSNKNKLSIKKENQKVEVYLYDYEFEE